ncbi:MAG: diacylglycerol kinase family lipid kinase [Bacteroidota bacterium]|nr:diacylglycerol kinase family lipid kinase [Candidatus Kapabacteria bacterium]MDW8221097.1 diacylglycerol kinase family lipid kinase [Bacteroidota bacterium]
MAIRRYKVIVNPAAGHGRTGNMWSALQPLLQRILGQHEVSFTQAKDDARILAHQALRDGQYDHIIAVGGDGTLNEVVNGFFIDDTLVNPQAVLSFIPSGTGSDVARTLGIPFHHAQAIARIAGILTERGKQLLDVGKIIYTQQDSHTVRYFLNEASCGMSSAVVQYMNHASILKWLGGKLAFYLASLRTLMRYRNVRITMRVEHNATVVLDECIDARVIALANGRYFGGGMMIAPHASPSDGIIDGIIVEHLNALQTAAKLHTLYTGKHLSEDSVRVVRGNRIVLHAEETTWIECDGEFLGQLPASIELLPAALPFV